MTFLHRQSKGTAPPRISQNPKLLSLLLRKPTKIAIAMIPTDYSLLHHATTLPKHLIKNRIPMPSHTSAIPVPKPSQPEAS